MTQTETETGVRRQPIVLMLAALLCLRGLLILFTKEDSADWNAVLGIGGLASAEAQFGALGSIMRVAQLIEGRLWVLAAFPVFFRLPWGQDVALLVAGLGMVVQVFRLLAGSGVSALVWLIIYAIVAAIFYAAPGMKAYLSPSQGGQ